MSTDFARNQAAAGVVIPNRVRNPSTFTKEVRVSHSYSHSIRCATRKNHHLLDPLDPLRATLATFDILRFVRSFDHDLVEYDDRLSRPPNRQRLGEGVVQPLRGGSGAGGG